MEGFTAAAQIIAVIQNNSIFSLQSTASPLIILAMTKQDLQPFYDAIDRIRRNDDGSAVMMRELERILGDFKHDVWQELNYRREQEANREQ